MAALLNEKHIYLSGARAAVSKIKQLFKMLLLLMMMMMMLMMMTVTEWMERSCHYLNNVECLP